MSTGNNAMIILDLIRYFVDLLKEAFDDLDPGKMRKVTDILDKGSDLELRAKMAFEDERSRREFDGQ